MDRLPIVPPDSPTARAAEESASDRSSATTLAFLWAGTMAAGVAIATVPYLGPGACPFSKGLHARRGSVRFRVQPAPIGFAV